MEKYLIIFILLAFVILGSLYSNKEEQEGFGIQGYVKGGNTPWETENTNRYTYGPNLDNNKINNWQYNSQNSLTDYTYYKENRDLDYIIQKNQLSKIKGYSRNTNHLAPLINGNIGKDTNYSDIKVEQNMEGITTRIPNMQSNNEYNLFSNPSTEPIINDPIVDYK